MVWCASCTPWCGEHGFVKAACKFCKAALRRQEKKMREKKPFIVKITPKPVELKVVGAPSSFSPSFQVTINGDPVFEISTHGKVHVWPKDMEALGLEVVVVK